MKFNNSSKGAEWRIWDLHVHSPQTYGGDFDEFIGNASKSIATVIGINDYCSVDGYEQVVNKGGIPGKIIFPVVEFRMHNILTTRHRPNGIRINFHVIFDNDPILLPKIINWVKSLKCLNERGENVQLGTVTDLSKVSFDFQLVIDSLKEMGLYEAHSLIWLPYDEYGGIDEIDPVNDGLFKISLINKSHIIGSSTEKQIKFFKWEDEKFTIEQYESWCDKRKPCIKGSDAHKINYPFGQLMNEHSQPIDKFCWINADMTFNGLKQIVNEPDRVYIGEEPDLLKRVRTNKTKFIESLSISKVQDTVIDDIWFDSFNLQLNSGLVAIIGNKGGGKSAVTDVIGLCGNTDQHPSNFSFLTSAKFRKNKPYNLSERFQATMQWHDGSTSTKKLSENPDKTGTERVKYIPQNFLENLCTNVDSEDFEKELKHIIFSHTPSDKRLGKNSLDELINYKSSLINEEIVQIQNAISKINLEIVNLEMQSTESFRLSIEGKLNTKKAEEAAHLSIMPAKPETNGQQTSEPEKIKKLTALRDNINSLEEELKQLSTERSELAVTIEELTRISQYYANLDDRLKQIKEPNTNVNLLLEQGINPETIFSYQINTKPISDKINGHQQRVLVIEREFSLESPGTKSAQLSLLKITLESGQAELDKPAKEHQKYLDDLKNWENMRKQIQGDTQTEDSLLYYENILKYLKDKLVDDLNSRYTQRNKLVEQLYDKKVALIDIRKELFKPVTKFIEDFKELKKRYDVKIDVSLELRSFAENFFLNINQQRRGSFAGKEDGYKNLIEIMSRASFNNKEGFIAFTNDLIDHLKNDKRGAGTEKIDINSQLRNGIQLNHLYDFIFSFNYLQPIYNLKLGTKTLQELSPGERGALLLIFYLILDNDDIPLIIDQPEENLDNESVYHILVHFIRKVKERRQIVIVTHNPNLAIVCDADQIIYMNIEKDNKNSVRFYSGAIEDKVMNQKIINILEGTLPAFNNRDSKYFRER